MKRKGLPVAILCGGLLFGLVSVSLMSCGDEQVTRYLVTFNYSEDFTINGINESGYAANETVSFTITVNDSTKKVGTVTRDGETLTPNGTTYSFVMGEANTSIVVSLVPNVIVESVEITGKNGAIVETDIFDNTQIQLEANVVTNNVIEGDDEVDWSLSGTSYASIEDGYLIIDNMRSDEAKELTVTATSIYDETKHDSITFTVNHSIINLTTSYARWNKTEQEGGGVEQDELDLVDYKTDGLIIQDGQENDSALIFNDIHSTKFYIETEFKITGLSANDKYPKIGLMIGTNDNGTWNQAGTRHGFFYFDSNTQNGNKNWNTFAFIDSNESDGWNWNSSIENSSRFTVESVTYNEWVKIGLIRDGTDYYLLAGTSKDNYSSYGIKRKISWNGISANTETYAWFGGWRGAYEARNLKVLLGTEVEEEFGPQSLQVKTNRTLIYKGNTAQISVSNNDSYFNKNYLKYSSNDENIATVDENGLVTAASDLTGTKEVTIKVTYDNGVENPLTSEVNLTITDDAAADIRLDGSLDDGLRNSVNEHTFKLNIGKDNSADEYAIFYGKKNVDGLYIAADYYVKELKHNSNDWWENDNFECRFHNEYGSEGGIGQLWISTANGGSANFDEFAVSQPVLNEETGLYNIHFETVTYYSRFGIQHVTEDDYIGFSAGINNTKGWHATYNHDNDTYGHIQNMGIYITENGLEENIPFTCREHELYSIYDKLPTCLEAGTMHEECMHCDYSGESIEIPASEEYHQWVITETTTESTCSSHGTGSAECSVCGETTASLPLDPNKHTKWNEEAGICDDCHNYYNEPTNLVAEAWTLGGFNKNFNSAEYFNVTINLNTKLSTNLGATMYQAFVGDICSIGWANGGISINSGASSWGAWGDKTDYLRVLNNKFGSGSNSDLVEAYKDADVELNVDRSTESNRITLNAIVTSNVEGYEDGFAQILLISGKTTNRNGITVTIGAEKANVTFYSAYINEGKLL